jgi:uncharacterized membrane protein YdbT with pleckstrin-like domain
MKTKRLFSLFTESELSFQGKEQGESVVMILRQHIFTIIRPLSLVFLAALVPILVRLAFAEEIAAAGGSGAFLFLASAWYALLWLLAFYLLTMYALNTVIITDRRIVENEQLGLFNRKVSELHLYRVQDVSVRVEGAIPTFLSYGDVMVQTASSEPEFVFRRVPHPERVKDAVMRSVAVTRERFSPAA